VSKDVPAYENLRFGSSGFWKDMRTNLKVIGTGMSLAVRPPTSTRLYFPPHFKPGGVDSIIIFVRLTTRRIKLKSEVPVCVF